MGHAGRAGDAHAAAPSGSYSLRGRASYGAKAKRGLKKRGGEGWDRGWGHHRVPRGAPCARPALEVVALLHPVQPEVLAVFSALLAGFVVVVLVVRVAVPVSPVSPRSVRPPG